MELEEIVILNSILEKESKSSTYKFALLRATIDSMNKYHVHFKKLDGRRIAPLGFLVEAWVFYYYPMFEDCYIPQISGKSKKLAIETALLELINHYKSRGGFDSFYQDYIKFDFDVEGKEIFIKAFKKIRSTIMEMPMRYFGNSVNHNQYSYYQIEETNRISSKSISRMELLLGSGYFSIDESFYTLLSVLGSLLIGTDSIINKWSEYSFRASEKEIGKQEILEKLLQTPGSKRDILFSDNHFKKLQESEVIQCVWSGKKVTNYHLDHLIPFSAFNNNDLWNVLPASPEVNQKKSDKIPSKNRLMSSRKRIFNFWEQLHKSNQVLFVNQLKLSFNLDFDYGSPDFDSILIKMQDQCEYLITKRGYEAWE